MKTIGLWVLPFTALFLAACGDSNTTTGSGGSGGTGGTGGTGGSGGDPTTTTVTTGGGGSGGTGGTVVASCATAMDLELGALIEGDLAKTGQEDYYKFEGTKGQVLFVEIDAQDIDGVSFDPEYIDSVVTLYDGNEKRIAENNNPSEFRSADSRLYTILPADGNYCLRVAECWTAKNNPAAECQSPQEKSSTFYELFVAELVDDGTADSYVADPEGGDDAASAAAIDYSPNPNGGYYASIIWGYYEDLTDVDVYTFTLPVDVDVPIGSRASASFNAFTAGVSGTGSTIATGELVIVDPATPDLPYARLDPTKSDQLQVPLELDKEYLIFVNRPQGAQEANDFYLLTAFPGWGNPVETADLTNDLFATAESIDFSSDTSAFIEGDLLPITDLDHYTVDVPPGSTNVTAVCGARTQGSGLRNMKITILGANGMPLSTAASDTETATQLAQVVDIALGANATVVLKVEAASQAADASSGYYQCGVHFGTD